MKKDSLNIESQKWNKVYEKEPENLPWFGLDFPPQVDQFLSQLDKDDLLLVTGCGFGDVPKALSVKGFTQVIGTDISKTAIDKAKERFPGIAFETIATEEIPLREKFKDVNVFDWLNLHQVSAVGEYLKALGDFSKNLCIVWVYDSSEEKFAKSYVHDGNVYYHSPGDVEKILNESHLSLKDQFTFSFTTNPKAGSVREHKAVGQIYGKE